MGSITRPTAAGGQSLYQKRGESGLIHLEEGREKGRRRAGVVLTKADRSNSVIRFLCKRKESGVHFEKEFVSLSRGVAIQRFICSNFSGVAKRQGYTVHCRYFISLFTRLFIVFLTLKISPMPEKHFILRVSFYSE